AGVEEPGKGPGLRGEHAQKDRKLGHVGHAGFLGQADEDAAQQADNALGSLDVAAQPVEVVGLPAGKIAARSAEPEGTVRWRQKAEATDRMVAQDPGILAAASFL